MYVFTLWPTIDVRLGYYYKVKASKEAANHGLAGFQNKSEHLNLSTDRYLRRAVMASHRKAPHRASIWSVASLLFPQRCSAVRE